MRRCVGLACPFFDSVSYTYRPVEDATSPRVLVDDHPDETKRYV